jgi:hypothetical protein
MERERDAWVGKKYVAKSVCPIDVDSGRENLLGQQK